jgi:phosphate transport system substrate-binding protein
MKFIPTIAAVGLISAALIGPSSALDISGAGATFPYPVYAKWADTYKKETGVGLNYQSIGSGAGLKQIQAKTVTFGATDAPLTGEQLAKDGLVQWPMVMGAIVPVINLEGVKPGEMVLDGATLANIYLGKITKWDDPAIKKLNAKLTLPSTAIAVVRRSDGSGTTFNFTDYLSKVSDEWKTKVGSNTAVEWPVGVGARGNEGVAGNIAQTKNSIGYVEYAYAKQNKLTHLALLNAAGKTVQPTPASVQAAAANAEWAKTPGYRVILTNQPGDGSWPITAATFILMHKQPTDKAAAAEAIKFFAWAFDKGDKAAEELDYIPMPDAVVDMVKKTWGSDIKS